MTPNQTAASFEALRTSTPGPLIVDFWAEWCGPCAMVAPALERLAREHPEVRVAKVNVDDEPRLALEHGVLGIPTLIRFDNGQETSRVTGAATFAQLVEGLGVVPGFGSAAA